MSVTRDHGGIVFECDDCHDYVETFTGNWQEALDEMKANGFRSYRRRPNMWFHFCEKCWARKTR
jgi:radical SAM protein with 4Fe4S-binding SPASM domain